MVDEKHIIWREKGKTIKWTAFCGK